MNALSETSLLLVNSLSNVIYHKNPSDLRKDEQLINEIYSSASFPSIFFEIFDNVTDQGILIMLAVALKNKIGRSDGLTLEDLNSYKVFILGYLLRHTNAYSDLTRVLSAIIGRITKNTYLTDIRQTNLLASLREFFNGTMVDQKMGFEVLTGIVQQMNTFTPQIEIRSTHRSVSIAFCDMVLPTIMKEVVSFIPAPPYPSLTPEYIVYYSSLFRLFNSLLQFDFSGTRDDTSSEEVEMIVIPQEWAPFITRTSSIEFLFYLYSSPHEGLAAIAAESILYLMSIRRSIFASPSDASQFFGVVLRGLLTILQQKTHLEDITCQSLICQTLSKLKMNLQLNELVKYPEFPAFFHAVSLLAQSIIENQGYFGSFPYVLYYWARIVEALRFTNAPIESYLPREQLDNDIMNVVHSFIFSFVDHVEVWGEDSLESPIYNVDKLFKYCDRLGIILGYQHNTVTDWIMKLAQDNWPTRDLRSTSTIAWCIMLISICLKRLQFTEMQVNKNVHFDAARLCSFAFDVSRVLNEQSPTVLYESCLLFMNTFLSLVTDYKLSLIVNSSGDSSSSVSSRRVEAFRTFFSNILDGDTNAILDYFVLFILFSFTIPSLPQACVDQAILLFTTIAHNANSRSIMVELPSIKMLIHNHQDTQLSSFLRPEYTRYRTKFYSALTEILFEKAVPGDLEHFINPFVNRLRGPEQMDPNSLILLLRDVTGIFQSCFKTNSFLCCYDVLCPYIFPLIEQYMDSEWNNPFFSTAVFRFLAELSLDRKLRIDTDDSSPRIPLFFRYVCSLVERYIVNAINACQSSTNQSFFPLSVMKELRLIFTLLSNIFMGDYMPFGAFFYYEDPCVSQLMNALSEVMRRLTLSDLESVPKLGKAFFFMLHCMFTFTIIVVSSLPNDCFFLIIRFLTDGIRSDVDSIVKYSCSALDSFATYVYQNQKSLSQISHRLEAIIQTQNDFWYPIFYTLFDVLLFTKTSMQWDLSRPLLSIFLVDESTMSRYAQNLCLQCEDSYRNEIMELFGEIAKTADRSLEAWSRESFTLTVTKLLKRIVSISIKRKEMSYTLC